MTVYGLEKLKPLLEVRSEILQTGVFTERIVYKDWGKETEVIITIEQTGSPIEAQRNWIRLGVTPWAWRYTPLQSRRCFPRFTFVLNRLAKISIVGRTKRGELFDLPTPGSPDPRHNRYNFSEMLIRWTASGERFYSRHVIPSFRILRPQHRFSPLTQRPDQFHELISEALIYFPRHEKDKYGLVRTQPFKFGDIDKIQAQVARYPRPKRGNRHTTMGKGFKGSEYIIISTGDGHIIRSVEGEYQFEITPKPKKGSNITPAYNFEFTSKPDITHFVNAWFGLTRLELDRVRLYVHRTEAVEIRQQVDKSLHIDAEVLVRTELPQDVGYLGEPIGNKKLFKPFEPDGKVALKLLLGIFTGSLALIPGWGWVLSLALSVGELVYTYHTGRDFIGDKVSPSELAALGIVGILGAAGDAVQAIQVLQKAGISVADDLGEAMQSAFGQLSHEYQAATRGSVEAIDTVGDHPVVKVIASLNDKQRARLTRLVKANGLSRSDEYVGIVGKLLEDQLKALEKRADKKEYRRVLISILEMLLTPDGKTFANEFLRKAYRIFLDHPNTLYHRPPLVWLHTSDSKPVIEFLTLALGKNYRHNIGQILRLPQGRRVVDVVMATEENIHEIYEVYDVLAGMGLRPYRILHAERRLEKWNTVRPLMMDCLQFEHPLEKRFAQNLTGRRARVIEGGEVKWVPDPDPLDILGIDVEQEFLAYVVPRTRRHATLLAKSADSDALKEGSALLYTQHPKTGGLNALIPKGAEHLATPQEIADAVCYELLKVNFDKIAKQADDVWNLLEKDFETLTILKNFVLKRGKKRYKVPVLTRSLHDINPALRPGAEGWPNFAKKPGMKDYNDITNLPKVKKARKKREAWAEDQRQKK